jgi:hypothetical protein
MRYITTSILLLILSGFSFQSLSQSYINEDPLTITAGNQNCEIKFKRTGNFIKPQTLYNKRSGQQYSLESCSFELTVSFLGENITPPKNTPIKLDLSDFSLDEFLTKKLKTGNELQFKFAGHGIALTWIVVIHDSRPHIQVYVKVKNLQKNPIFLEKISVFGSEIPGLKPELGGFGQPVYGRDIFFGVEFPAAYSEISSPDKIKCWHRISQSLQYDESYNSHSVVIGFSDFNQVQSAFFEYIEKLKAQPTKPFLLYNTWYDIRDFSMKNITETIDNFEKTLVDRYDLKLDAFVIDDGWDNLNSVWDIDRSRFPGGFSEVSKKLKAIDSNLGLWISPWNGYGDAVNSRVEFGRKNGYEVSGNHLCLGGDRYYQKFLEKTLLHLQNGDLSFYKIDGFLSLCNANNHGHLPGINSREFLTRRFISVLKEIRKIKPEIFIDITVGTWLSPWWLMHADAVWMTGADYGHAEDVPAYSERDKAITFRDYTLYKDFVRDQLQFPLRNVMTHGIIKGKLNLLGGDSETLRNWLDNAVMYFSRGVMLWELYISPEVLSNSEWDILAKTVKWAYKNQDILKNTRMIGGNPYEREIYGYFHPCEDFSLLILRNPFAEKKYIRLNYEELMSGSSEVSYLFKTIYPHQYFDTNIFKPGSNQKFELSGYEVKILKMIPQANLKQPVVAGIQMKEIKREGQTLSYDLFLDPAMPSCIDILNENNIDELYLNDKEITGEELKRYLCKSNKYSTFNLISELSFRSLDRKLITGSLSVQDTTGLFRGDIGLLLDFSEPCENLNVKLEGLNIDNDFVVRQGAGGAWYWIIIPIDSLSNAKNLVIKNETRDLPEGKFSIWALGELNLIKAGILSINSRTPLQEDEKKIPVIDNTKKYIERLFESVI